MVSDSTVGIGLIGCGYWGPNLLRNFCDTPGARMVAVSDLRTERLATVAPRYPAVKTSKCHDDLLRDPTIDAVVIATPVSTHFELALAALEAGEQLFVEEPFNPTSE